MDPNVCITPSSIPLTLSTLLSIITGNYTLIMDPNVCAFDTPENLLTEMICQRLAQVLGLDLRLELIHPNPTPLHSLIHTQTYTHTLTHIHTNHPYLLPQRHTSLFMCY